MSRFDDVYTEDYLEELVKAVYRVAPIVYDLKAGSIKHLESKEDFVQEAAVHITNLFNTRYIHPLDEEKGSIDNLVSSLLSGIYLVQKWTLLDRDGFKDVFELDLRDLGDMDSGEAYKPGSYNYMVVKDPNLNADELHNIKVGKHILEEIIEETLSDAVIEGRKYTYTGFSKEYREFVLSEHNIMKHILLGYNMKEIVSLFGLNDSTEDRGQANFIRKIITETLSKVKKQVAKLNAEKHNLVESYVNNTN